MSSSGLDLYYINSYVLSDVLSIVVTIVRLRESLTFVTLPETTVTSNKSYSYLHWVTIVMINSND
jgi:hypothetical protein